MDIIDDLLQVLNLSLSCQNVRHFQISSIAFIIAIAYLVNDRDNVSSLVFLGYMLKTKIVKPAY